MSDQACPNLGYSCNCSSCAAMNVQQTFAGASPPTHRPQTLTIPPSGAPPSTALTTLNGHHPGPRERATLQQPLSPAGPADGYQMHDFLYFEAGKDTLLARSLGFLQTDPQDPPSQVNRETATKETHRQGPSTGARDTDTVGQNHGDTANDNASQPSEHADAGEPKSRNRHLECEACTAEAEKSERSEDKK